MTNRHINIVSAELNISQHKYKSGYERPAHPAEPPAMVCKAKACLSRLSFEHQDQMKE